MVFARMSAGPPKRRPKFTTKGSSSRDRSLRFWGFGFGVVNSKVVGFQAARLRALGYRDSWFKILRVHSVAGGQQWPLCGTKVVLHKLGRKLHRQSEVHVLERPRRPAISALSPNYPLWAVTRCVPSSFHCLFHYPHITPMYYSSFHFVFQYPHIIPI